MSKPTPADPQLYQSVRRRVLYTDSGKRKPNNAFLNGHLVKEYKKAFAKKHGNRKKPYKGKKDTTQGLGRWYREDWTTQDGGKEYKNKNDIFRPRKRITKDTPLTHKELTKKEIESARRKKSKHGRVNNFR